MTPAAAIDDVTIHRGDCLAVLPTLAAKSVRCCVTSPPYWGLRSYLPDGVVLKADAPQFVIDELARLGITPMYPTSE